MPPKQCKKTTSQVATPLPELPNELVWNIIYSTTLSSSDFGMDQMKIAGRMRLLNKYYAAKMRLRQLQLSIHHTFNRLMQQRSENHVRDANSGMAVADLVRADLCRSLEQMGDTRMQTFALLLSLSGRKEERTRITEHVLIALRGVEDLFGSTRGCWNV